MRARSISIASMVAFAAGFVILPASPALAGPSCSFSGSTLTIDLSAFPSAVVRTDGNAIIVADNDFVPVNCGGSPTVTNTDLIEIDGSSGDDLVLISLQLGGHLAPGLSGEASGTSEIEIDVDLGAHVFHDDLQLHGTSGPDQIVAGGDGDVNVNGDDDADLIATGVEVLQIRGRPGEDDLSLNGGSGTGVPLSVAGTAIGDDDADDIVGGPNDDSCSAATATTRSRGSAGTIRSAIPPAVRPATPRKRGTTHPPVAQGTIWSSEAPAPISSREDSAPTTSPGTMETTP